MLSYTIDHVVWAHPDLDEAVETFTALGFGPVPGGRHGSGATQNALIPFADGSYIELLARVPGGGVSPLWEEPLAGSVGWCDWCLGVPDMGQAARHLRSAGYSLKGPFAMHRDRPGGLPRAAWELAFVRQESAGGALPFVISDTAPREYRVPDAPEGSEYRGIAQAIVAVPDGNTWAENFGRYFGATDVPRTPRPDIESSVGEGATFTELGGLPVVLAEPSRNQRLGDRVARYGPMLCGIVLKGREDVVLLSGDDLAIVRTVSR